MPTNPGRLINLSILTSVTATEPLFPLGMAVGGASTSGAKLLLWCAAGPSLSQIGVGGPLTDPELGIFQGQTVFSANDNWGVTGALSTAFAQLGAFPFTGMTSRDAAVYNAAQAAGSYYGAGERSRRGDGETGSDSCGGPDNQSRAVQYSRLHGRSENLPLLRPNRV